MRHQQEQQVTCVLGGAGARAFPPKKTSEFHDFRRWVSRNMIAKQTQEYSSEQKADGPGYRALCRNPQH